MRSGMHSWTPVHAGAGPDIEAGVSGGGGADGRIG